jgi:hypothetical protein
MQRPVDSDCGGNYDWCFLQQQIYMQCSTVIAPGRTLTFSAVISRSFPVNRARCPLPGKRRMGRANVLPMTIGARAIKRSLKAALTRQLVLLREDLGLKNGLAIMASVPKPRAKQVEVAGWPAIRVMCRAVKLHDEIALINVKAVAKLCSQAIRVARSGPDARSSRCRCASKPGRQILCPFCLDACVKLAA